MSVIYIVLPLAILVVGGAVFAFVWGVRHGQFDDLDTPAIRVATEDDLPSRVGRAPRDVAPAGNDDARERGSGGG